jgi:hypothetical protein
VVGDGLHENTSVKVTILPAFIYPCSLGPAHMVLLSTTAQSKRSMITYRTRSGVVPPSLLVANICTTKGLISMRPLS